MEAVILIGHVGEASPVYEDVFGLGHQRLRQNTQPRFRIRGDVAGDLPGEVGITNIVYPETRIEVSEINPVVPILTIGVPLGNVEIMGPESAALFTEVLIGDSRRRFGDGK
jgi:hypothetical protein